MIRWYIRRFRSLLGFVALGAVASVIGALVVQGVFSAGSGVSTSFSTSCDNPKVEINFPRDGLMVNSIVDVLGTLDCLRGGSSLWITVTPPLGSPHGIHPVSVEDTAFFGTAVLASGAGEYRICVALADRDAQQTFQGAISQDPPIGLSDLPATSALLSCVEVLLGTSGLTTATPTPRPSEATPTPSPCPATPSASDGFTTLEDELKILRITVPSRWCDVSTDPIAGGVAPAIEAAADLNAFEDRLGPGVEFTASSFLLGFGGVDTLLDFLASDPRLLRCTYEGRFAYQRAPYAGMFDQWTSCPGLVTDIVVLAAGPPDGSFLAIVEVFMAGEADRNALEGILNSFEVSNLTGGQ